MANSFRLEEMAPHPPIYEEMTTGHALFTWGKMVTSTHPWQPLIYLGKDGCLPISLKEAAAHCIVSIHLPFELSLYSCTYKLTFS